MIRFAYAQTQISLRYRTEKQQRENIFNMQWYFCSDSLALALDVKAVDKHEVKTERQLIAKAKSSIFGLGDSIRSSCSFACKWPLANIMLECLAKCSTLNHWNQENQE